MSQGAQRPTQQFPPATMITHSAGNPKRRRSAATVKFFGEKCGESHYHRYRTRSVSRAPDKREPSMVPQQEQFEFGQPGENDPDRQFEIQALAPSRGNGLETIGSTSSDRVRDVNTPEIAAVTSIGASSGVAVGKFDTSTSCLDPFPVPAVNYRPAVVDATAQFEAGKLTSSGGTWSGGRRRVRLRLSLKKRRILPESQPAGTLSTAPLDQRDDRSESAPHDHPWGALFLQQRRSPFVAPEVLPASRVPKDLAHGLSSERSLAVTSRLVENPLRDQPPPPPFVGLVNLGETCYINSVVQALVACSQAMMLPNGCSVARDGGGVSGSDRIGGKSEVASASSQGSGGGPGIVPCSATLVDGGGLRRDAAVGALVAGDNDETLLTALDNLMKEVDTRNRVLPVGGFDDGVLHAAKPFARTDRTEDAEGSELGMRPGCESPSTPRSSDVCQDAVAPEMLVRLVREIWLGDSSSSGDIEIGERPRARGLEVASTDLGYRQQCASELLGKLLDLGASCVNGEIHGIVTRLSKAFRGSVCTRTLCVECERDRLECETFTELVLPPLLSRHLAPDRQPSERSTVRRTSSPETLSVLNLVEETLGRESLVGNNKVWCQFCRQRTEAERRSTLHCSPPLLALHFRPAVGGLSAGGTKSVWGYVIGPHKAMRRDRNGRARGDSSLIERVMTIQGVSKCQFHGKTQTGAEVAGDEPKNRREGDFPLPNLGHSNSTIYDLVGIILHQGRSLSSGHYTFARYVAKDRAPDRSSNISPTGTGRSLVTKTANAHSGSSVCPLEEQDGRESDEPSPPREDGNFVIFDDDCVRWLLPEEERILLNGGGLQWGLGDVFLVFYVRRHS